MVYSEQNVCSQSNFITSLISKSNYIYSVKMQLVHVCKGEKDADEPVYPTRVPGARPFIFPVSLRKQFSE